jgi:hypothetical protein
MRFDRRSNYQVHWPTELYQSANYADPTDSISYSELHSPVSLSNININNDRPMTQANVKRILPLKRSSSSIQQCAIICAAARNVLVLRHAYHVIN